MGIGSVFALFWLLCFFAPFNFAYILPNPRNRYSPPLSLPIGSPFHFHFHFHFPLYLINLSPSKITSSLFFSLFSISHSPMSPAPGLTSFSGGLECKQYPSPVFSHDHVLDDSVAFWDSLRRFHFLMGSKFMIPVIGGKELNLHVLYVEVTKRGGYEKVVAEKKWREVGNVFNFSPTTTSASYVLRKHYSSLLYHYEQVYFFRAKGPLSTPSVAASPVSCRPEMGLVEYSTQKIRDCPHLPMEAVGTIDGKFDCGYLVSVKLGSEILSGVLYHPEEAGRASTAAVPQSSYAIVPYAPKPTRSGRRRRNRRGRDPSYPKPNRSGYNFYFAEKHFKLKSLYPNREREFTKMIGESWSSLGPEERLVYQNIGLKDKERYKRELKEYKEKLKVNGGGGGGGH